VTESVHVQFNVPLDSIRVIFGTSSCSQSLGYHGTDKNLLSEISEHVIKFHLFRIKIFLKQANYSEHKLKLLSYKFMIAVSVMSAPAVWNLELFSNASL